MPGATITAEGVTKDDPNRTTGSWNQTAGSAKEFVGGLVGNEVCSTSIHSISILIISAFILTEFLFLQSLKQSGREQNLAGQEQEARGQVKDYTSGLGDRVSGAVGSAAAGLTGDRVKQAEYQNQHDAGKTQQRGAEHDIQKQAEARQ